MNVMLPKNLKIPKSITKKSISIALAGVIVVSIATVALSKDANASEADIKYDEHQVTTGGITKSIAASGTLNPADSYTVTTLVSGTILSDTFENGDIVVQDDLLYTLDSSDVAANIEKAEISLAASQRNYTTKQENLDHLNIRAGASGMVYDLTVDIGDTINANQIIGNVQSVDSLEITLQFLSDEAETFSVGNTATLMLDATFEELTGTITHIAALDKVTDGNRIVKEVTFELTNTGGITETHTASASLGAYTSTNNSNFTYKYDSDLVAQVSGEVSAIYVSEGDAVSDGEVVVALHNSTIENDVITASESVRNAELSLETQMNSLDNYMISSPISGTVVQKNYKSGDVIAEKGETTCIIYDLSHLETTLNIDELDILSVVEGVEVLITSDSVEGKNYTGIVTAVSHVGQTLGGVTSYPVTVEIAEYDGLLTGMNISATIITAQSDSALKIPVIALNRDGTVLITEDSPSGVNQVEKENTPDGYVYVKVETGISDGQYIEILSGLSAEDIVVTPIIQNTSGGDTIPSGMLPSGGLTAPSGGAAGGGGGRGPGGATPSGR